MERDPDELKDLLPPRMIADEPSPEWARARRRELGLDPDHEDRDHELERRRD